MIFLSNISTPLLRGSSNYKRHPTPEETVSHGTFAPRRPDDAFDAAADPIAPHTSHARAFALEFRRAFIAKNADFRGPLRRSRRNDLQRPQRPFEYHLRCNVAINVRNCFGHVGGRIPKAYRLITPRGGHYRRGSAVRAGAPGTGGMSAAKR